MTVRLGSSGDVGANALLLLLLVECRGGVVLMNGTQGWQRVFEEMIARSCKNELSAHTRADGQGDKQCTWRIERISQWFYVC